MKCHDIRIAADRFVSGELTAETRQVILDHLALCSMCRSDIEMRRRLRGALRNAFTRAPELQVADDFRHRLNEQLRDAAPHRSRFPGSARRWLALAAGIVVAVSVSAAVVRQRSSASEDQQAHDAIGDHRNCALHYRLVRHPVPLEEAAQRFDRAYRLLMTDPPDEITTPTGPARVIERHACEYGAHRFGHVILRYRDRVVSLLVTTADPPAARWSDMGPRVIGRPFEGLSVVSVNASRHAVMVVGDLHPNDLTQLARVVSLPVVQQLAERPPR